MGKGVSTMFLQLTDCSGEVQTFYKFGWYFLLCKHISDMGEHYWIILLKFPSNYITEFSCK
jgi:hypothetical protein